MPLSRRKGRRLFGWHVDADTGLLRQRLARPDGSLWSPQLTSWLRPDGMFLRFYDPFGRRRLTKNEVDEAKAEAETERAERESQRAQEAIRRAEAIAEKLRALWQRVGLSESAGHTKPSWAPIFLCKTSIPALTCRSL